MTFKDNMDKSTEKEPTDLQLTKEPAVKMTTVAHDKPKAYERNAQSAEEHD